jgi:hypothetical protein
MPGSVLVRSGGAAGNSVPLTTSTYQKESPAGAVTGSVLKLRRSRWKPDAPANHLVKCITRAATSETLCDRKAKLRQRPLADRRWLVRFP